MTNMIIQALKILQVQNKLCFQSKKNKMYILSKKNNYIKTGEIFNNIIIKINNNKSLFINKQKLGIIIFIIKNYQKQFLKKKNKSFEYLKTKLIEF